MGHHRYKLYIMIIQVDSNLLLLLLLLFEGVIIRIIRLLIWISLYGGFSKLMQLNLCGFVGGLVWNLYDESGRYGFGLYFFWKVR